MDEKNECKKITLINLLLKIILLVVVTGVGIIAWRGFERLQQEIFSIKVVMADFNAYMQGK